MGRRKNKNRPRSTVKRGQHYFPQLEGLQRALHHIEATAPRSESINAGNNLNRDDADIQARLDRQAAKLARRAQRAGNADQT